MQDVFEPMNFSGEVFEPMANFKGEGGNTETYVEAGKQVVSSIGQLADARAKNKEAKSRLELLKSERQRELEACANNPAFKKFLDRKKRNNRIRDCQEAINKRFDEKEKSNKEIAIKSLDIQKEQISLESPNKKNFPSSDKFLGMPKKVGIGVTIGVGVLLLGVTAFLIIRKRK
jgi:hypothetical protein